VFYYFQGFIVIRFWWDNFLKGEKESSIVKIKRDQKTLRRTVKWTIKNLHLPPGKVAHGKGKNYTICYTIELLNKKQ